VEVASATSFRKYFRLVAASVDRQRVARERRTSLYSVRICSIAVTGSIQRSGGKTAASYPFWHCCSLCNGNCLSNQLERSTPWWTLTLTDEFVNEPSDDRLERRPIVFQRCTRYGTALRSLVNPCLSFFELYRGYISRMKISVIYEFLYVN
jgi:hypothetical protein